MDARQDNPTNGTFASPVPHRILVIANETVAGHRLHDEIVCRAEDADRHEVLVVCPALNSRLRHWLSDEDAARQAAGERLTASLDRLGGQGVTARGWVGDADPLQAIADALRVFTADELLIATHPAGRSNWLEHGLIERARERFPLPVGHVVVDVHELASV